jgi:hypothetical protein
MDAGAAHKKGGMALAVAWLLCEGIVAADKMGHGVAQSEGVAKMVTVFCMASVHR